MVDDVFFLCPSVRLWDGLFVKAITHPSSFQDVWFYIQVWRHAKLSSQPKTVIVINPEK